MTLSPSYWAGESIRAYVHNSQLQRRWAMAFLAPHLKNLSGNEKILDIGCGDGKITADLSNFVPNGSVVGVDPSKDMISWALSQYDTREYPNLHFQNGDFFCPRVKGPFDLIASLCSIHHCSDHSQALEMIHRLLKPEGKLLILVPSAKDSVWRDTVNATCQKPDWSAYWEGYIRRTFLDANQYKKILSENHFRVVNIETIDTVDPFVDKQDLISWMIGTYPPRVPAHLASTFYSEIVDEYIRTKPDAINEKGAICISLGSIRMVAEAKL